MIHVPVCARQIKLRAIIALKWLATDSCIQLIKYDKNPSLSWKNVVNHAYFVMQNLIKITLLLLKVFAQNFTLVEGLWIISCLNMNTNTVVALTKAEIEVTLGLQFGTRLTDSFPTEILYISYFFSKIKHFMYIVSSSRNSNVFT